MLAYAPASFSAHACGARIDLARRARTDSCRHAGNVGASWPGWRWAPPRRPVLARFGYGLILPAMRTELRWSLAQAGALTSANGLG
jgi:hypothetical protein